jgi:hypothetical protein
LKDRLATLVLAAGAFVLFYVFFVPKPQNPQNAQLPLSTESGDDGYQAIWRWLRAEKIPVSALHEPYTRLSAEHAVFAPHGNVLITTLPHRVPARTDELNDLDLWIGRGNTLLVMAALDDTPRWAMAANTGFLRTLGRMTRINFEADYQPVPEARKEGTDASSASPAASKRERVVEAVRQLLEPQRALIDPSSHPLFDGVHSILAISEFPASHWRADPMDSSPVLEIGHRRSAAGGNGAEPAVWLRPQGDGQIIVFAFASTFSNRAIAEKDNARLLSNIIAWSRGRSGAVIFDDDHQGAVSYYDAKAFFHDARLHRTILWILVLWLLYVLGSQRMRPGTDAWNPADITSFIGVTGGFFASVLTPSAAGSRLFSNFFNALRRNLDLPEDGTPVWEWLAKNARVEASSLAELQRLHARTRAGQSVDLVRLHNILSRLRGTLE